MIDALLLLLVTLALFLISALPLYFAVKVLGGKAGLFGVLFTNLLVAIVSFIINFLFDTWGGLFAFVLMIWIYKEFFELGWLRALLAWLLQFVFAVLILLLLSLLGVTVALF